MGLNQSEKLWTGTRLFLGRNQKEAIKAACGTEITPLERVQLRPAGIRSNTKLPAASLCWPLPGTGPAGSEGPVHLVGSAGARGGRSSLEVDHRLTAQTLYSEFLTVSLTKLPVWGQNLPTQFHRFCQEERRKMSLKTWGRKSRTFRIDFSLFTSK